MNSTLWTRRIQLAGLLLLAAWWMTSAQSAVARPLPPGDPTGSASTSIGSTSTPLPVAPIVVHDHPSTWTYLLVASFAVAVTLGTVWAIGSVRRATAGRQARQLQAA